MLEPKIAQARREAEKTRELRQEALWAAKSPFAAWAESSERCIRALVRSSFESAEATTVMLDQVKAEQAQYPLLCRVEVKFIDPATIQAAIVPLQQAVADKALVLQTDRLSVLAQLGASASQVNLLEELSKK